MLLFVPLLLLYASSYFQRTAVPGTIFSQLQADLGLNAFQIAGIGASFVYIYALSQLVVGMLADKYGGARVVTAGGILSAPARSFFLCWTISADCISAVCLPDSEPAQCI